MVARGAVSAANRRRRLALRAAQMYPIFRLHRSNHAEVARSICTTRCADAIQRRSTTSATRSASAIPPSFATCIRAPPGRPGNRARIVLLAPDVAVPGDQQRPAIAEHDSPGALRQQRKRAARRDSILPEAQPFMIQAACRTPHKPPPTSSRTETPLRNWWFESSALQQRESTNHRSCRTFRSARAARRRLRLKRAGYSGSQ